MKQGGTVPGARIAGGLLLAALALSGCDRWRDYRSNWVGTYEGPVEIWTQYPSSTGGTWIMFDTTYAQNWTIEVRLDGDSSLALTGFRGADSANWGVIKVPESGVFFRQSGGGSGYAELGITFAGDSLVWNSFNKCGIPCSSGSNGVLRKP